MSRTKKTKTESTLVQIIVELGAETGTSAQVKDVIG